MKSIVTWGVRLKAKAELNVKPDTMARIYVCKFIYRERERGGGVSQREK